MGAAQTVTGSRHLLTVGGKKLLLDCGMYQEKGSDNEDRNMHFGFDPHAIDYVILSHAHIDHSGCLPRLFADGFRGPVYATPATIDLCRIMLADSAHIQESDVYFINKRRRAQGRKLLKPLYTMKDVDGLMELFHPVHYGQDFRVNKHIHFRYTDSGHILGSAAVNLTLEENGRTVKLFFSGDIGRYHDMILRAPENFPQADYIITESTYGDRLHEPADDAAKKLADFVNRICVQQKGKLVIPAFSLGRTQEIVYALNNLWNAGKLPRVKVFVDSPLSADATDIMRRHTESYNAEMIHALKTDPDPFGFKGLTYIRDVEDSKALNSLHEPCVIISASGMVEAGRVKHHVANTISDPKNGILMVGFAPSNSLGGKLIMGAKEVRIFGDTFKVNATVESLHSYSAHGDYKEMLQYLSCQDPSKVKKVFLVHGELPVQENYRGRLLDAGFHHVEIPSQGSHSEL